MTFAGVGSGVGGITGTTATWTTSTNGDFVIAEIVTNSPTVWCTALSGGGCASWSVLIPVFHGTTFNGSTIVFIGTVTSAGSNTVTATYNGATPGVRGWAQEFSSTVGSWALDTSADLDGTAAGWPSMTPAGSGELYFGFAYQPTSSATPGSTPGYTYGNDGSGNGWLYDAACTSSAQTPTFGDTDQRFGIALLMKEVSGAAVAGTVQPRATLTAPRRRAARAAVWFRPAVTVNAAAAAAPGTVQPRATVPAARRRPARAVVGFVPVATVNAAPAAGVPGTVPALMVNQTRRLSRRDGRVVRH